MKMDWSAVRGKNMRGLYVFVLVGLMCAPAMAVDVSPEEIANRRCFNCHGQKHIAELPPLDRLVMVSSLATDGGAPPTPTTSTGDKPAPDAPLTRPGLYLSADILARGVHPKLACVDCHADADKLPHNKKLAPASCSTSCHAKAQSDFLQGSHAEAAVKGDPKAPRCATCHGGHDILPKENRKSTIHPLNILKICGDCHQQHTGSTPSGQQSKSHIAGYMDSVHGRALLKGGLAVAATCADCHGNHTVLPSKHERSLVHRTKVADTCGKCHIGLSETYATSIHGRKLADGDPDAPTCNDCHTSHNISRTTGSSFKLDIINECGECHDKPAKGSKSKRTLYDTYRLSYHGQATALGMNRGARCSDCHGAHNIKSIEDPDSRLSPANRVDTCRQCHEDANENFAKFEAHADFHDSERYPLFYGVWLYFVIMMSGAFGFFGLHSIFWFLRSSYERIKHGPHPKHAPAKHAIKRFTTVDKINHVFVVVSFFGLTITGLPLLFSDKAWGRTLAWLMGGGQVAGILHRGFAIMLFLNLGLHFLVLLRRTTQTSIKNMIFGPNTLLPRWKDVQDCFAMFRWFLRGGKRPHFDRWTYFEKFDYIAEIGGSMIIGLSGLLLWFPQFFALFLPGWVFNVAMIIHGYEAMLAIVFIFTIHFFNAHLRVEKFPVDDVIFTGQLSEEEFKLERPAQYERLAESGELDSLREPLAPGHWRKIALVVGPIAVLIGTTLAVLIILAGLDVI
jgi:cytochrome b subunit of formate dehydrogenase